MQDNKAVVLLNTPSSGLRPPSPSRGEGNNVRGFTLIELLVVVLIIGILAAVALPQYQKAVLKSRLVQMQVYMDALHKSADIYYLANASYPNDVRDLDIDITPAAIEVKQTGSSRTQIGAYFKDDIECIIDELTTVIVCRNSDFALQRYQENTSIANKNHPNFPNGKTVCFGRNDLRGDTIAEQICQSMSDGVPLYEHTTYHSNGYVIGN